MTAAPQPSPDPSTAAPPLVSAVLEVLAGLADGNGAVRSQMRLVSGETQLRPVGVALTARLGWSWQANTVTGQAAGGGERVGSFAQVDQRLEAIGRAGAADSGRVRRLAEELAGDPQGALLDWPDERSLEGLGRVYAHEGCTTCGQAGRVRCGSCSGGRVNCGTCSGTGKGSCGNCSGSGRRQEQFWNNIINGYDYRYVTCSMCWGSGRFGPCYLCYGSGRVECGRCGGSSWVACSPCGGTGWFTRAGTVTRTAQVQRAILTAPDAPARFAEQVRGLTGPRLGRLTPLKPTGDVTIEGGAARLSFGGTLHDTHVRARCADVEIDVTALGAKATIFRMPPFLDQLLEPLARGLLTKRAAAATVLAAANAARVTRAILAAIGQGKVSAPEIVGSFDRAVSPEFVSGLAEAIRRAYDRSGRRAAIGVWLLGTPLAMLVGGLLGVAFVERLPTWQNVPALFVLGLGALAVVPVVALDQVARRVALRTLRQISAVAARPPPQRVAGALALGLTLAATWLGTQLFEAFGQEIGDLQAAAASRTAVAGLRDSGLPPLEPFAGAAATQGDPEIFRTQEVLAALGLYQAALDGRAGPRYAEAAARLEGLSLDPPATYGVGAAELTSQLRSGLVRLRDPDAPRPHLAPFVTLPVAAAFGPREWEAWEDAVMEALERPGHDIPFGSVDAGGTVRAERLPAGCGMVAFELTARARSTGVQTERLCP